MKKRFAIAGGFALTVLALALSTPGQEAFAQTTNFLRVRVYDALGNAMSSLLAGGNRAWYVVVMDPATGTALSPTSDATHGSAVVTLGPQVMLEAETNLSTATPVSDAQAARQKGDYLGRAFVLPGCGRENRLRGYLANTDGASTALTGMGAQGANIYIEIWAFIVWNSSAVDVGIDIRDGTGGAVLTTLPAPATTDTGGGAVIPLPVPITMSANTAVAMDTTAAATTVYVTALGCAVK